MSSRVQAWPLGWPASLGRIKLTTVLNLLVFSACFTVWVPISIDVGGLNLRLSQMALPIVILALLRPPQLQVSLWSLISVICAALWWVMLVVWTLFNDRTFGHPAGRVALMALNLVQALAAYLLIVRIGSLRPVLRAFLWSVTGLNLLLLVVTIAPAVGVPVPAGWLVAEGAPMYAGGEIVSGTVNRFVGLGVLAGCVSAAAAALAFCLWFDPGWQQRRLLLVSGIVSIIGMIVAFSRQSVMSLAAGLLVGMVCLFGRGHLFRILRLCAVGIVAAGLAAGVVALTPNGRDYLAAFAGRTMQLGDPEAYTSGTASSRAVIWDGMLEDIAANPFVGRGQDAYLRYMDLGEGAHNFPLEVLHSTGLGGFVPYAVLHLLTPLLAVVALLRRKMGDPGRAGLVAVLAVYVAVTFASVTNIIYWNPVYWLVLAMMVAAVRLVDRQGVASSANGARV